MSQKIKRERVKNEAVHTDANAEKMIIHLSSFALDINIKQNFRPIYVKVLAAIFSVILTLFREFQIRILLIKIEWVFKCHMFVSGDTIIQTSK